MKMIAQNRHHLIRLALFAFILSLASIASQAQADQITIDVAPKTLNLQNQGQVVTVHTEIGYSEVDVSSVYLNGILIDSYKADNQGYFVAKFLIDAVKSLPLEIDAYNTLKLVGLTKDNLEFWGEYDVYVVNNTSNR